VRERWQRMAAAVSSGTELPAISAYRARCTSWSTAITACRSTAPSGAPTSTPTSSKSTPSSTPATCLTLADLPLKAHERVFFERVPLPPAARARIALSDPSRYGQLADAIEAWGYRRERQRDERLSREQLAAAWLTEEYDPVVAALAELRLCQTHTQAEAYLCVATERYRLLHTTDWTDHAWEQRAHELA
jgi:hypothetical protein